MSTRQTEFSAHLTLQDSEQQMILTARRSLVAKVSRHQPPQIDVFFLNIHVRRSRLLEDSLKEVRKQYIWGVLGRPDCGNSAFIDAPGQVPIFLFRSAVRSAYVLNSIVNSLLITFIIIVIYLVLFEKKRQYS